MIKSNFKCKLIAWSFALGALTLGSAQPGGSIFDGAISKDNTAWINPSARVESLPKRVYIRRVLNRISALFPATALASPLKSVSDRDLTPSLSAPPANFGLHSLLPEATNAPLVELPRMFSGQISSISPPVATSLPTTGFAFLESVSDSDRDLTRSISASPFVDSESPNLPVSTNEPHLNPPKDFGAAIPVQLVPAAALLPPTASTSQKSASDRDLTLSISAIFADSGSLAGPPVSTNKPLRKAPPRKSPTLIPAVSVSVTAALLPTTTSASLKTASDRDLTPSILAAPPTDFGSTILLVNSNEGHMETSKQTGSTATSRQTSSTTSESQNYQQQTNQRKEEHQTSTVSNLGRASHLALSTNHVVPHFPETPVTITGTVISSLTSKALVIANATIQPSTFTSSQCRSFFAASNFTTAAAGSAPFDNFTSTLNSTRNAGVSTLLFSTPGSVRYMRVMHTSTEKDVDLPTGMKRTSTSTSTSISISLSGNTMAPFRGFQSKTHVSRMIFGGCIIFALIFLKI